MAIQKLGDIRLAYEEFGTGDRYLLCAQQSHSLVDNYCIDLAEHGFHVFLITIRGYGASTHITGDYGDSWYDVWARDVCDFATAKGIDRFCYTGVSHGAGIGWHVCVNHPERVIAFFSVVGGPHSKDGNDTGSARMATIQAAETPEKWAAYVEKMMRKWNKLPRGDETPEELALREAKRREQHDFWLNMTPEEARINPKKPFPKLKTEEELVAALSQINLPVLHLGGMRDDIALPENELRSCRAVKGSKLVLYEDATHGLDGEHKSEVVEDILAFCRGKQLF